MNRSTKLILIIGLVTCFIVVPLGLSIWFMNTKHETSSIQKPTVNPPKRSNEQLMTSITTSLPQYLDDNGKPTITILRSSHPHPNWYIAVIILNGDTSDNYAKVLINDPYESASGLRVVLGPGTAFTTDDTNGKGIPDSVLKDLNS